MPKPSPHPSPEKPEVVMASMTDAMTVLYPNAVPWVDYEIRTTNGVDTLVVFNRTAVPLPDPTPAQIAAVTQQQVDDAAAAKSPDRAALLAQADAAIAANTTYLAIGSPNNAQVVAQVRALTQQSQKVISYLKYVAGKVL